MTRLDAYKHLNSANGIYTTLWDASFTDGKTHGNSMETPRNGLFWCVNPSVVDDF